VTTADRTLAPGAPDRLGWTELVTAPGEVHHGGSPHPAGDVLVSFVHLSDLHLCDAESPARLEYLDHHGDPGAPYAGRLGTIGTYRPQEILTVQVAVAALQAVHRVGRAPVTGAPLDAVLVTGDMTDNAQRNELRWYTELMSGRPVTPRSGGPLRSSWVGACDAAWRPFYWHPEGPAVGQAEDLPTSRFGYPAVPGLVEAARTGVPSPGAGLPWFSIHGNHDALLQGTVAPDAGLRRLATGSERIVGLAEGQTPLVVLEATAPVGPARYTHDATSPRESVRADAQRAVVEDGDFEEANAAAAASHGGDRVSAFGNAWACDVGQVRVIALDTVNPNGGWQGSVDEAQLAWLADRLDEARDRYVVIASHHPSWTLTNAYSALGMPGRNLADDVLALLLRHRGVVAWVAGHVHAHTHLWHQAPDRDGGLWEITTSSLIDWPQQFRVLELVREAGGTLALASTVVDHTGVVGWDAGALAGVSTLAGVSRTLALNDYRARGNPTLLARTAGRAEDRNAVWRMPDPHPRPPLASGLDRRVSLLGWA
jgi:metallophosphoesterase (TIGR03767 family)